MVEIFLAPRQWREVPLQRGSVGEGLQGESPPCMDIFLILGKIGTFSELFF
jgi:hypothetical protein